MDDTNYVPSDLDDNHSQKSSSDADCVQSVFGDDHADEHADDHSHEESENDFFNTSISAASEVDSDSEEKENNSFLSLHVGMTFDNFTTAQQYIDNHARVMGFATVCKKNDKNSEGNTVRKQFRCEHSGTCSSGRKDTDHPKARLSRKINCPWQANLYYRKQEQKVGLTKLHSEHNHALEPNSIERTANKYLHLPAETIEQIEKYVQHGLQFSQISSLLQHDFPDQYIES